MSDLRRGKPRRIRQRVGVVNMRRAADHAVHVAARISDWEQQVRADERERIAQEIEVHAEKVGAVDPPPQQDDYYAALHDAARIARGGESDG